MPLGIAKFNAYGSGCIRWIWFLALTDSFTIQFISGSKASFEVKASGELEIIHAAVFFDDKLTMYGTNQQARMSREQINKLRFYIKKANKTSLHNQKTYR